MFGRSVRLSFVKDPQPGIEPMIANIDPEKIEEIARRSVLDVTKLVVAAAGSLMILHTALSITEDKLTDKND